MERSILIKFNKSRSPRFAEAARLARFFTDFQQMESLNVLDIRIKEVIEKWEWFNELFWILVDWKGTTLTFDGITYHSHQDKTRIFYTLQQIHSNWMNFTSERLITAYNLVDPISDLLKLDPKKMTDEQVSQLIDVMLEKKRTKDEFEEYLNKQLDNE